LTSFPAPGNSGATWWKKRNFPRTPALINSNLLLSCPLKRKLTPMMAQYRRIKGELPKEALLLFRLGDFYEMFFEDAQAGAQLLNLALTSRNGVPMCGLPHHAANSYIARILRAGRKVAICDQLEDARPGKLVNARSPRSSRPARISTNECSWPSAIIFWRVYPHGKIFGLALVDLTTGDFLTTEVEDDSALLTELERLRPAEIIHPGEAGWLRDLLRSGVRENAANQKGDGRALTAQLRVSAGFSAAMTTGRLRRRPPFSLCAIISRWRRSTASG